MAGTLHCTQNRLSELHRNRFRTRNLFRTLTMNLTWPYHILWESGSSHWNQNVSSWKIAVMGCFGVKTKLVAVNLCLMSVQSIYLQYRQLGKTT